MKISIKPYSLDFKHPFGVSSNTRHNTISVFIKLEAAGKTGYGEACIPEYLGETLSDTVAFLESSAELLKDLDGSFELQQIIADIDSRSEKNNAAKAALDIALHDLKGKIAEKPFYELAGIGKSEPMTTSFTIGIDKESKLEQKIIEASDFSVLKIKAGTADDIRLIRQIRKYTNKPLYVDVNQGWRDRHHAINMISRMKEEGVILIEQPMPVKMREEMHWVKERSSLPLIADESVKRLSDLDEVAYGFSGINIKLMKCTGLSEAIKMIKSAREKNMKVLLGCMAESTCATAAMAQLMKLADYIDLDAPNLYKNDPFEGLTYRHGKVILNDEPGIGVKLRTDLFF
jgi:L-alanine-DL-glutamate epimerase-like enolase superfamily enzyme